MFAVCNLGIQRLVASSTVVIGVKGIRNFMWIAFGLHIMLDSAMLLVQKLGHVGNVAYIAIEIRIVEVRKLVCF